MTTTLDATQIRIGGIQFGPTPEQDGIRRKTAEFVAREVLPRRLDTNGVLRNGDMLARLLDTFVAAQLRPELEVSRLRPSLYHLREAHGRREIDLLGEVAGGVGIEVKATA